MKLKDKIKRMFKINGLRSLRKPAAVLGLAAMMMPLVSCEMVNEDMEPCAEYPNTLTTVKFVYDYNMLRDDLFNEHVGTVHLYVFDEDGIFQFDKAVSRTDMLGGKVDFTMTFDTTYLKIGKRYMMVAMAQGNHGGYESSLETPGFQIPLENQMIPKVSKLEDYRIKLDRDDDQYADFGIVNFKDAYGNNREMMDTLWSTKPNQVQIVDIPYIELKPQIEPFPTQHVDVTIPMMRITNSITVNMVHDAFTPNTDPDRYNILINFPNGNGTIGFTGTVYHNQELYYRSLRKVVEPYQPKKDGAQYDGTRSAGAFGVTRADPAYSIRADFGVSRLLTSDGSNLQIRNAQTNEIILQIGDVNGKSFSDWLADYFSGPYDNQQFLDREYDFTIDIHMDDQDVWDWYQIGCSVLGWGKREYNYELH